MGATPGVAQGPAAGPDHPVTVKGYKLVQELEEGHRGALPWDPGRSSAPEHKSVCGWPQISLCCLLFGASQAPQPAQGSPRHRAVINIASNFQMEDAAQEGRGVGHRSWATSQGGWRGGLSHPMVFLLGLLKPSTG